MLKVKNVKFHQIVFKTHLRTRDLSARQKKGKNRHEKLIKNLTIILNYDFVIKGTRGQGFKTGYI